MLLVLLILFSPAAKLQDPLAIEAGCPYGSCNPPLGDLMVGRAARLSASSTCGLDGQQNYCIIGYLEEEQKCFTCDSRLPYSRHSNLNSHRIENVITTFDPERKLKWWQSENGVHEVSIQLDLETVFQFSHLVLTFKSFRPAAMLVERSKDFGQSWKVFRYFAEDCSLHFPSVSAEPASSVDDVVCDGRYSGSEPSTDGEVVLKALDPIFEIENPYAANIQDLITLTNIRINFTRLFTLGDTLLARRRRNPQEKYYYALYNMVVRGSCFCNGHASQCMPVDPGRGDAFTQTGMVYGQCVCQHNTAGENCERCQDFHHDSPWRPGGENTAHICRRCNCNGHSDSCHFDATRFDSTGGVSGGVCDDCRHDRAGPQCERCRPFLYQDPQRAADDPHACIPCDCDGAGSEGGGLCDALSGQCVCKENVEGQRCDRCKPGTFGLRADDPTGCQACTCHALGSIGSCDQQTGSCECDRFAVGPTCDRCVAGFWGLGESGFRCSPCDCNIGGAQSYFWDAPNDVFLSKLWEELPDNKTADDDAEEETRPIGIRCSSENGQCHCLPNIIGRRCTDPAPGYFLPQLDYFLYEAELSAPLLSRPPSSSTSTPPTDPPSSSSLLNPVLLPECEQYYRERGYDFKFTNGRVVLLPRTRYKRQEVTLPLDPGHALQLIPRQRSAGRPVTWTGLGLVRVLEGAGLRFTVDNLPSSMDYQLVIRYEPEAPSDWLASVSVTPLSPGDGGCSSNPTGSQTLLLPGNSRGGVLDSLLCLNAGGRYFIDVILTKQPGLEDLSSHILIDSIGLTPNIQSNQSICSQTDALRPFRCIGLAAELDRTEEEPEVCKGLVKSMSAHINRGAVPCRCHDVGSLGQSCSKLGGFCDCKPNVIGRCCDTCSPLTFGFGPTGCQPCDCTPQGAVSEMCDQVSGQCACRSEVTGRRCDRCQSGFWDFPLCQVCECHGLSHECNQATGECLNCREHTSGPQCDRCVDGYLGNPVAGQPCQPCLCPDIQGSGRFFATSCLQLPDVPNPTCICREGHTGDHCDRCSPGYHGNLGLPGASCQVCDCNNNINTNDLNACDRLTGECLRCLHNTTGPRCGTCRPGYYGHAPDHDCKECSCDRRGTVVTQCPLGSPCFCDGQTGQCPCRVGATGVLCDLCADGFWNIDGPAGCQPCNCDTANAQSNVCDKVTGQCPCRAEFGGRQCDECGENHFGNPDLQCISCDCNMEGTQRPSCDPDTGECLCRVGVTGIFCDQCAPGYNSEFPACEPCHVCATLWARNVTDVQRAAVTMRTLIPRLDSERPGGGNRWQQMLEMHSMMDELANLTGMSPPTVEKMEKLCMLIGKLKDAVDPNVIVIDPSPVLNTEMDDIEQEFKKLLDSLKEEMDQDEERKQEDTSSLLEEIQNLHKSFMADEKRIRNSSRALEDSMDTRQEIKLRLSTCSSRELGPLDKKIRELSMVNLNRKVCGEPGLPDCSGCGGALCVRGLSEKKCGGPDCDGALPVAQRAKESAENFKNLLKTLPDRIKESKNKVEDAKQAAKDSKDQAKDLQDQISTNMDSFEKEKQKTKDLIQKVKDYLTDEMIPPEDIEKMARTVLNLQLPRSPDQVQSMIDDINKLLTNTTNMGEDLKNLEKKAKSAGELLKDAQDLKDRTKNIDVTEISKDIYKAEEAQANANDDLETASNNSATAKAVIQQVKDKLQYLEAKLMDGRVKDLKERIEELKKKNEQNEETATDAQNTADNAVNNATDTQAEVADLLRLFDVLKMKKSEVKGQSEAEERLKKVVEEAESVKKDMMDKLTQIDDLEQWIDQLIKEKQQKADEVSKLLQEADQLRTAISKRSEQYISCSS